MLNVSEFMTGDLVKLKEIAETTDEYRSLSSSECGPISNWRVVIEGS